MKDLTNLLARAQEISSDAERVTQAHLRKVTLPTVEGRSTGVMGLITLDNGEDHTAEHLRAPARSSSSTPRSTLRWPTTRSPRSA